MRRRWLSLYVENRTGVLARISGLLSGKGYNIHSLTVGETEDTTVSRMTICVDADDKTYEQIKKQLNRSVEVIKVLDYTDALLHNTEVMFIKIRDIGPDEIEEVFKMGQVFSFKITDMDSSSVLIEALRTEAKNDHILNAVKSRFSNIEVVRGGPVAIEYISMPD